MKFFFGFFLFFIKVFNKFRSSYWNWKLNNNTIYVSSNVRLDRCEYIEIGRGVYIGRFCWIEAVDSFYSSTYKPVLTIGNNVKMSEFVHIGCVEKVIIGDDVLIGSKCLIIDHSHGLCQSIQEIHHLEPLISKPVYIGDNVFLGDNVCVLPGVSIGNNSIIGANSVVTQDIPSNAVAHGSPARVKRYLNEN
ncbi:acyltransferase [Marinomonas sp. ef1]|uniref:acyltransferase n=1 Tax=Marinomonas sp. ef1 TaxID=2005043 RepID=UPI000C28EF6B|nr:acyltransferase [Marinomonas sp. ef1]|tara:strand:- start:72556 stop:73128 length:573 start_codon:yes stop_codon:yes gene_type:complete